jgi:hypothetical protein
MNEMLCRFAILMLASGWVLASAGCAVSSVAGGARVDPSAPGGSSSVASTCLSPYWAGLLAGESTLREVAQLLGSGYSTERQGEDVRLYTDPSRSSTLVVTFGTDNIVTTVDLWETLDAELRSSTVSEAAVSRWVRPHDGIGAWGELHLGSTTADVRKNMGEPRWVRTQDNLSVWSYSSVCACDLQTGFTFRFAFDRLVSFGVWAENG